MVEQAGYLAETECFDYAKARAAKDDARVYGPGYVHLCRKVLERTGIDLARYKGQQMHRRLDAYRQKQGFPSFYAMASSMETECDSLGRLLDYITINVSEFFRNPEQWDGLIERVIPMLRRSAGTRGEGIFVWSAGASSGQEAYTVAMALDRHMGVPFRVLGTDIHRASLDKAISGTYSETEVRGVPPEMLEAYFDCDGGSYTVKRSLKRLVSFQHHNLLSDEYPSGVDLVLCRNVMIYFTAPGRDHVLRKLSESMVRNGVFFAGSTEAIVDAKKYGLTQILPFFYQATG